MIIEQFVAMLGFETQGEADLKRFQSSFDSATKKIAAFASVAGAAAGAAVAYLGKNVITLSAQFESYTATLETIEGSSEKAKASMDWIAEFAKTTPYNMAEVTEAFIRMRAYGLDPMDGTLEAVGDAGSAMGKSLMDGVEAVADAMTSSNERLKNFGVTASVEGDKVTYSWQENGKTLTRTMKKSGMEVVKFIKETFGLRFGGAMLKQSKTWNGMVSNLGDTWDDFQRRIGEGGFFNTVKDRLGDLLDTLGRLDKDGSLDRWSKSLSNGFTWAVDLAEISIRNLIGHFKFLSGWVNANPELWKGIAAGLSLIAAVKFPWLAAVLALDDVLKTLQGGDSVINDFAASLAALTGLDADGIAKVLAAVATGVAGYVLLSGPLKSMAGGIRALTGALSGMAGSKVTEGLANIEKAGKVSGAPNAGSGGKAPGVGLKGGFALLNMFDFITGMPSDKDDLLATMNKNAERSEGWNKTLESWGLNPSKWIRNDGGKSYSAEGMPKGFNAFQAFEDRLNGIQSDTQPQRQGDQRNGYQQEPFDTSRVQRDNASASGGFNAFQGMEDRLEGKTPTTPPDTWSMLKSMNEKMTNWQSYIGSMSNPEAMKGVAATLNDSRQDNRNQSVNPSIVIHQTVTTATQAPGALAAASGAAVSGATRGVARVEQGPAF